MLSGEIFCAFLIHKHMQLGIGSYTYTWSIGVPGSLPAVPMNGLRLVQRAHELGVRRVQIADNIALGELPTAELAALESHANALEVAVEVGTRGIGPSHLLTYLALAQRFRSKCFALLWTHPRTIQAPMMWWASSAA